MHFNLNEEFKPGDKIEIINEAAKYLEPLLEKPWQFKKYITEDTAIICYNTGYSDGTTPIKLKYIQKKA